MAEIGNVLNSLSEPSNNELVSIANQQVLDFHVALETVGHDLNLNGTIHGLTETGETIGLGFIGEQPNLITDVVQAPGSILNGANPVPEVSNIVTDVGEVVSQAGEMVQGIGSDLSNPSVIGDVVNGTVDHVGQIVDALPDGVGGGDGLGGVLPDLGDGLGGILPGTDGGAGNGDAIINVDAGQGGGTPIIDAGVLGNPNGGAPISVAVGSGENILDANVLGDGGLLTLPNLGGTGTDALTGLLPDLGLSGGGNGGGAPAPGSESQLLDVHTDGSALIHFDVDHPDSLLGVNTHTVL